MRNKFIFLGITALFMIAVAVIAYRFIVNNPSIDGRGVDFNQIGNLVRNNPGLAENKWYLVYEEQGQPGLLTQLQFDSASACAVNSPAAPCDPSLLQQGARVRVEGITTEIGVLVRALQSDPPFGSDQTTTTPPISTQPTPTTTATGTKPTAPATSTAPGTSTTTPTPTTTPVTDFSVKLYYYNPNRDKGPGGPRCTTQGLVAVGRTIPKTDTPIEDTIRLLLRGELSSGERGQGITTDFPLSGLTLLSSSINNSTLTLTFSDPQGQTSGGSCRVTLLRNEIEATAKQFTGVKTVEILPKELFQP